MMRWRYRPHGTGSIPYVFRRPLDVSRRNPNTHMQSCMCCSLVRIWITLQAFIIVFRNAEYSFFFASFILLVRSYREPSQGFSDTMGNGFRLSRGQVSSLLRVPRFVLSKLSVVAYLKLFTLSCHADRAGMLFRRARA